MEALYTWSYENLLLLSRSAPGYGAEKEEDGDQGLDASKVADNPGNFNISENSGIEDEEIIR